MSTPFIVCCLLSAAGLPGLSRSSVKVQCYWYCSSVFAVLLSCRSPRPTSIESKSQLLLACHCCLLSCRLVCWLLTSTLQHGTNLISVPPECRSTLDLVQRHPGQATAQLGVFNIPSHQPQLSCHGIGVYTPAPYLIGTLEADTL